ncbi:MAG TPA: outer membrane protein transport protein [Polyangiaceae bacterium]|nr:outer membrane protein transport protein [Polyangiaceae bacterium]
MKFIKRAVCGLGALGILLSAPRIARAGGYDTPMLYSARHMGMGGAAIGYVRDPSGLFHNPAGLGHIQRGELIADFSLLVGGIHASPGALPAGRDIDSEKTVAPFFLVGGAYRLHPMITLGVGVFPIASAGATYKYGSGNFEDSTQLFFLETTPAIAVNPLPNLRFGLGYRITYVHLSRYQGDPNSGSLPIIDFKMSGQNFTGFRAGVQWSPLPWLEFGAVFRNTVNTKVTNSHGIALQTEYTDISTHFKLPAKLGFGSRVDFDRFHVPASLALDFEYAFNSQNKGDPLEGTPAPGSGGPTSVANIFEWKNSQTYRVGAEYRILHDEAAQLDRVPLRVGYVYDTQTANANYPTAFGTPPGPTQVVTVGTGYNGGVWQANVAYAYRFGSGAVTDAKNLACPFCSYAGKDDYSIYLHGIYLDASYKF